jgi:hypothetical protein
VLVPLAVLALIAGLARPGAENARAPAAVAGGGGRGTLLALPLAAQAPASAALGASEGAYRARGDGAARLLVNPRQHLAARFADGAATFWTAGVQMRMRLLAIGSHPAGRTLPVARANRVSYDRGGATEWYANGPLGVEQGFTIPRALAPRGDQPLTISLALSANARVGLTRHDRAVVVTRRRGASLRVQDLLATDASGRDLGARFELRRGVLLIRIPTAGARYPLRVDPLVQQGSKLTGGEAAGAPEVGTSVAMSADGNTALLGGVGDEGAAAEPLSGAAWVFVRSGSTWTQQGPKLRPSDESGPGQFGISVALSGDGNTALIGGDTDSVDTGAAWVFARSGGKWSQQGAKLTGKGESGPGRFGESVALSSDGSVALIGGIFDEGTEGAAWVFARTGASWTQQGSKLVPKAGEETPAGRFGRGVALSADGSIGLVGAGSDGALEEGAVWAFARGSGTWSQQGPKLTEKPGEGTKEGHFGTSVAISAAGDTALVGAPGDGEHGAAWVFTRSGASWSEQGPKLTPSDAAGNTEFGAGVALSSDGNTALIGGPTDQDAKKVIQGAAWEFSRAAGTWSQQGTKFLGSGKTGESEFGFAVALAADGDTGLIGDPLDGSLAGAGWVYVDPPPAATTEPATTITSGGATLNGTLAGGASSSVRFEYGTTTAYGSATAAQALAASAAPRTVAAAVASLAPASTYHYRVVAENSGGTSDGADQTFTTAPPPQLLGPAGAVTLTAVAESHRLWREGARPASIARARRPPVGTVFSFKLSGAATVTLRFAEQLAGRRVGGRCLPPSPHNRGRHACRRAVVRGSVSLPGHAGTDHLAFQGRLSRTRRLPLGSYSVVIVASALGSAQRSAPLTFTIVR